MVVVVARVLRALWPRPVLLWTLRSEACASAASELAPRCACNLLPCTLTVLLLLQPVQAAVSLLQHATSTPAGCLLPALQSESNWITVGVCGSSRGYLHDGRRSRSC